MRFEDRWGHRAPSSSGPYLLGTHSDPRNLGRARVPTYCPDSLKTIDPAASAREAWQIRSELSGLMEWVRVFKSPSLRHALRDFRVLCRKPENSACSRFFLYVRGPTKTGFDPAAADSCSILFIQKPSRCPWHHFRLSRSHFSEVSYCYAYKMTKRVAGVLPI